MKTIVVQILTFRSLTSSPMDVVYAHEVPILKVIRGAGNISVEEENCTQYCLKPTDVKPRDELIRLKNKYKGFVNAGQNPVDVAFPDGSRDLELFYDDPSAFDGVGEEDGGGTIGDDEEDSEVITDEGEPAATEPEPEPEPESGSTESVLDALQLPSEPAAIDLNDRPAVVAKLTDLGVPYAKTTATKHLATLLTKSLEPGATD